MTEPSFVERRTVSRKTAGDGRLEITREAAQQIERLPAPLVVEMAGDSVRAALGTLPCTCRGAETPHVHHFLQADELRALAPGAVVELVLNEGRLSLRPVPN
jgi:hypothetical protein